MGPVLASLLILCTDMLCWQQIGLEEPIIKENERNQLTWYSHVQRMAEGRLPKVPLKWMPKQKRARGRPKKNWMEGIRKAMNEINLNEGQWEEGKQWSLGVGQRTRMFRNRCIHTYNTRISKKKIYNVPPSPLLLSAWVSICSVPFKFPWWMFISISRHLTYTTCQAHPITAGIASPHSLTACCQSNSLTSRKT